MDNDITDLTNGHIHHFLFISIAEALQFTTEQWLMVDLHHRFYAIRME